MINSPEIKNQTAALAKSVLGSDRRCKTSRKTYTNTDSGDQPPLSKWYELGDKENLEDVQERCWPKKTVFSTAINDAKHQVYWKICISSTYSMSVILSFKIAQTIAAYTQRPSLTKVI